MDHSLHTTKKGFTRQQAGFTMFFAVLVSSLALAIGLAIYDLVVRELEVSSTTEQSQYAIYAADSAVECALYWDYEYTTSTNGSNTVFATSSSDTNASLSNAGVYCNGQDITSGSGGSNRQVVSSANAATTTSSLTIGTYYAIVQVVKLTDAISGTATTTIYSYGFNTSATTSPNAVERELQVSY